MATRKKAAKKTKVERFKTETGNVGSFISDGFSEITSVGEEFREIVDNAPDNLKESDLNSRRGETADAIENFSEPSVSSSILEELECTTSIDLGKTYRGRQSQSRACRASNGAGQLRAAADSIRQWLDENDEVEVVEEGKHWRYKKGGETSEEKYESEEAAKEALEEEIGHSLEDYNAARSEAEELADSLEEIADEADGLDYPGMFG